MVKFIPAAATTFVLLSLFGCSDAGVLDTPRDIDTLNQTRTLVRVYDAASDAIATVYVGTEESMCTVAATSSLDIKEFSDGTRCVSANVAISNTSAVPILPVDVANVSIIVSETELAALSAKAIALDNSSSFGLQTAFYRNVAETVDFVDSTRVPITMRRSTISERVLLNDLYITRTYTFTSVTDDTTKVPFSVFPVDNQDLSIDTSYVEKITHTGNRFRQETTNVEAPSLNKDYPIVLTTTVEDDRTLVLEYIIPAEANSTLLSWLGAGKQTRIIVSVSLQN